MSTKAAPNTGVVSYPEVAELFEALSPACALETAREESKRRLIWKGNRFRALPSGLFSAVTTPLFTLGDKFRILGEPFRAKGNNPDESVGELAARRLGKSFLHYAVDPFLSGVYAGDPMKLVTRYALPKLYNLEQQYGSFIRGTIAKAKQPKTDRDRLASKKVFSAAGGLDKLTGAMAEAIGPARITLSAADVTVRPCADKWMATYSTADGEQTIIAERIITTTGAYTLPALLPFVPKEKMELISNLHYATSRTGQRRVPATPVHYASMRLEAWFLPVRKKTYSEFFSPPLVLPDGLRKRVLSSRSLSEA